MWCEKCQADVPGIASTDNARVLCTKCGTELRQAQDPSTEGDAGRALRDPRELFARWAREDALERIEIGSPVARPPAIEKLTPPVAPVPAVRFDGSHPVRPAATESLTENLTPAPAFTAPATPVPTRSGAPGTTESRGADASRPQVQDVILHQRHEPNAPHFTAIPVVLADQSTRWVSWVGQILAYLGVGGLTIGTSLVLMGYFGGPGTYATTGWLVSTAGQMLLFLGVVTLVSSGMEQTTQEVARRIDSLGNRLDKIEEAAFTGKSHAPSQVSSASQSAPS